MGGAAWSSLGMEGRPFQHSCGQLYHRIMRPRGHSIQDGPPKALVVVLHDEGESSENYTKLGEALVRDCHVIVACLDFPGHGRSSGKINAWQDYHDVIAVYLRKLLAAGMWQEHIPLLMCGHGVGGILAIQHAMGEDGGAYSSLPCAQGYLVSSPSLRKDRNEAFAEAQNTRACENVFENLFSLGWLWPKAEPELVQEAKAAMAAIRAATSIPISVPVLVQCGSEHSEVQNFRDFVQHVIPEGVCECRVYIGAHHTLLATAAHQPYVTDACSWVDTACRFYECRRVSGKVGFVTGFEARHTLST